MADLARALSRFRQPGLREDSVKITASGVAWDRRLHSFPRIALLPGPVRRFEQIAEDLGLDLTALFPYLKDATNVHVGVEGSDFKLYIELADGEFAFLAIKRDSALNRYKRGAKAKGIVANACAALGGVVLEVTEDNSRRVSYDVHLADTELTVAQMPKLDKLLSDFNLPVDTLTAIADQPIGHFASGVGRDGKDFATIYYGARHDH
jgi:hypothetical protein